MLPLVDIPNMLTLCGTILAISIGSLYFHYTISSYIGKYIEEEIIKTKIEIIEICGKIKQKNFDWKKHEWWNDLSEHALKVFWRKGILHWASRFNAIAIFTSITGILIVSFEIKEINILIFPIMTICFILNISLTVNLVLWSIKKSTSKEEKNI